MTLWVPVGAVVFGLALVMALGETPGMTIEGVGPFEEGTEFFDAAGKSWKITKQLKGKGLFYRVRSEEGTETDLSHRAIANCIVR